MQGQNFQIDQIVNLAALALMLNTGFALDKACSPKSKSNPGNPEESELLKEFSQLNPELQHGVLKYASEIREGYKKKTRT